MQLLVNLREIVPNESFLSSLSLKKGFIVGCLLCLITAHLILAWLEHLSQLIREFNIGNRAFVNPIGTWNFSLACHTSWFDSCATSFEHALELQTITTSDNFIFRFSSIRRSTLWTSRLRCKLRTSCVTWARLLVRLHVCPTGTFRCVPLYSMNRCIRWGALSYDWVLKCNFCY